MTFKVFLYDINDVDGSLKVVAEEICQAYVGPLWPCTFVGCTWTVVYN